MLTPFVKKSDSSRDLTIFMIFHGNTFFNSGPRSLPRNLPDCTILDNRAFNNFILPNDLQTLPSFETCQSVGDDLCGKLFYH